MKSKVKASQAKVPSDRTLASHAWQRMLAARDYGFETYGFETYGFETYGFDSRPALIGQ